MPSALIRQRVFVLINLWYETKHLFLSFISVTSKTECMVKEESKVRNLENAKYWLECWEQQEHDGHDFREL